jgi:hypothetical protein
MEFERSLPYYKGNTDTSLRNIFILPSHSCLGLPGSLFSSVFPNESLYAFCFLPIRAAHPVHLLSVK